MRTNNAGVIVLGGHVQGYGIVKIYGKNNIPSIVIDTTDICIARHSKYCIRFLKSAYDTLLKDLITLANGYTFSDWLLIPTDDYYVRILSQNKEILSRYFKVSVDSWSTIENFFNKRLTYPLAQNVGVTIPQTFFPGSEQDLKQVYSPDSFPCIIKPAVMLDFYRHFKKKVFVCNSTHELTLNYKRALEIIKPEEIIIQEIIPGNSENQFSVGVFAINGKIINCLVARRKRQHPIDFGNATTFAETVNIPELVVYAERIIKAVKFTGICEVEFKYDERDTLYKFLEVNPRTWKWHSIAEKAHVPFLINMYKYFYHGNPIVARSFNDAAWRDILTDMPIIINMISKGVFNKSNNRNIEHAVFNISDIKPFIFQLLYLPYLILKR